MSQPITRIDLLRHGQPQGPECLRGHVDLPLSDKGWQQMQAAVADRVGLDRYQQVISSDLKRCAAFAEHFADAQQLPLRLEAQFREIHFGDWDGVTYEMLWQQAGTALGDYWEDPWTHTPPGAESMQAFATRVESAWSALVDEFTGKRLLLVTHGGVIRHLLARILQMPLPGTAHLGALSIPCGARVSVEIWHDPDGRQWPRVLWPHRAAADMTDLR